MGPFVVRPARPRRRPFVTRLVPVVAVVLALASPARSGTAQAADAYLVGETGHTLAGPFLAHWLSEAGFETLGNPVSEVIGDERETQYFEFGVLAAAGDGSIERMAAGAALARERFDPDARLVGKRSGGARHAAAFVPAGDGTGVTPSGGGEVVSLARRWSDAFTDQDADDGVSRLGEPISSLHVAHGKVTRWYDFGRLEAWTSDDLAVERAPVGAELARIRGVDLDPVEAGVADGLLTVSGEALFLSGGDPTQLARLDEGLLGAAGAADAAASAGFGYEAGGVFAPTRIQIPAIGVDAYIEQIGISADGYMGTPAGPMNVGWYSGVSSPGYGSNVVMAGHVDYYTVGPAVFYGLSSLGGGDTIYVSGPNGEGFTYAVTASFLVSAYADAGGILGGPGGESLTLITCGGSFNGTEYDSRTIIYAQRI